MPRAKWAEVVPRKMPQLWPPRSLGGGLPVLGAAWAVGRGGHWMLAPGSLIRLLVSIYHTLGSRVALCAQTSWILASTLEKRRGTGLICWRSFRLVFATGYEVIWMWTIVARLIRRGQTGQGRVSCILCTAVVRSVRCWLKFSCGDVCALHHSQPRGARNECTCRSLASAVRDCLHRAASG